MAHRLFRAVAVALLLAVASTPFVGAAGAREPFASPSQDAPRAAPSLASIDAGSPVTVRWSVGVSPLPLLRVTVGFDATIALPAGAIDAGSRLATEAGLSVPPAANLSVGYGNTSGTLPVSPLGSVGPVAVPGLNVTILGSVFQVDVAAATAIVGNLTASGPSSVAPTTLRWNGSGSVPVTVAAGTATPGDAVALTLAGIAYAVEVNVTAVGNVPVLGRTTVTLLPWTDLGSFPGSPSTAGSTLEVTAPPSVTDVLARPNPVGVGDPTELSARASGGSGPLTYAWDLLPPGCASSDLPNLGCTPAASGSYSVRLHVSDPQGESAVAELNLSVDPAAPTWTAVLLGPPVLVAVAAVAGLLVGLVSWRRRRARRRP